MGPELRSQVSVGMSFVRNHSYFRPIHHQGTALHYNFGIQEVLSDMFLTNFSIFIDLKLQIYFT